MFIRKRNTNSLYVSVLWLDYLKLPKHSVFLLSSTFFFYPTEKRKGLSMPPHHEPTVSSREALNCLIADWKNEICEVVKSIFAIMHCRGAHKVYKQPTREGEKVRNRHRKNLITNKKKIVFTQSCCKHTNRIGGANASKLSNSFFFINECNFITPTNTSESAALSMCRCDKNSFIKNFHCRIRHSFFLCIPTHRQLLCYPF